MVLFFIEFGIPWIWKWNFIVKTFGVDIPTLQRIFWVRWWNNFSKKDIEELCTQIYIYIYIYMAESGNTDFNTNLNTPS